MADARSAAQPSSPPRSPLVQQSGRLSKRAFKRTAQPAGPSPCWRPPLGGGRVPRLQTALRQFGRDERAELCEAAARQGLGGSETFKGCQRPLRRGYSAFDNRPDDGEATLETVPRISEILAAIRFFANNGCRQAFGLLSIQAQSTPIATHHGHIMSNHQPSIGAGDFKSTCLKLLDEVARSRRPLVITKHGKAVAQLVPMPPEAVLFGALGGSVVRSDDIVSHIDSAWDAML